MTEHFFPLPILPFSFLFELDRTFGDLSRFSLFLFLFRGPRRIRREMPNFRIASAPDPAQKTKLTEALARKLPSKSFNYASSSHGSARVLYLLSDKSARALAAAALPIIARVRLLNPRLRNYGVNGGRRLTPHSEIYFIITVYEGTSRKRERVALRARDR